MIEYMIPLEVAISRRIGNAVARRIQGNRPFRANAAIRHALTTQGVRGAIDLSCRLLNLPIEDAARLVQRLSTTRPDDIVSPHLK